MVRRAGDDALRSSIASPFFIDPDTSGVAAPLGVMSLSPSREGLRGVCRRARQEEQGRL